MHKEIFEKSTDGIMIIEGDRFIDCNNSILRMFGFQKKEDILNAHPSDLSPEYQPNGRVSLEYADEVMMSALENGSNTFEWVHSRGKGGEEFWVEVVLTNISKNGIVRIIAGLREIGEKKAIEKELQKSRESLEKRANYDYLTNYNAPKNQDNFSKDLIS